jgi:flagellar assembly protein FliH
MPTPVRRFMFDRSFDDPGKLYLPAERRRSEIAAEEAAAAAAGATTAAASSPQAQEPKAKPEFTKAQIEAAREEGYISGHSAALEEAGTAREHYIADALNLIAQGLGQLDVQQKTVNAELEKLAMRMVYGVVHRLLPAFAEQYAVDNIEAFIRQVLPVVISEPKLVVRAHPMIAADLDARLKDVFARASFQGSYSVITDYELQPGDCRLEWSGGGADRDEVRIWRSIREVIAANYGDVDVDTLDAAVNAELAAEQAAGAAAQQDTASVPPADEMPGAPETHDAETLHAETLEAEALEIEPLPAEGG